MDFLNSFQALLLYLQMWLIYEFKEKKFPFESWQSPQAMTQVNTPCKFETQKILYIWRENEYIPPWVGLHHHLHEKCEECEGKDTVSGVQHAAKGPANRPTHTAQPQVHTAADLREDRKKKKGCLSVFPPVWMFVSTQKNTETDICDVKMYEGNAGEIISAVWLHN